MHSVAAVAAPFIGLGHTSPAMLQLKSKNFHANRHHAGSWVLNDVKARTGIQAECFVVNTAAQASTTMTETEKFHRLKKLAMASRALYPTSDLLHSARARHGLGIPFCNLNLIS